MYVGILLSACSKTTLFKSELFTSFFINLQITVYTIELLKLGIQFLNYFYLTLKN